MEKDKRINNVYNLHGQKLYKNIIKEFEIQQSELEFFKAKIYDICEENLPLGMVACVEFCFDYISSVIGKDFDEDYAFLERTIKNIRSRKGQEIVKNILYNSKNKE